MSSHVYSLVVDPRVSHTQSQANLLNTLQKSSHNKDLPEYYSNLNEVRRPATNQKQHQDSSENSQDILSTHKTVAEGFF